MANNCPKAGMVMVWMTVTESKEYEEMKEMKKKKEKIAENVELMKMFKETMKK